ncbi:MAG: bacteriophage holin [Candidatus Omnitrophica bacterium]|nr:bacteriophage holin [Candidatus Omnitrophota bacterium]
MNKLSPRACGLAFGILWSAGVMMMGLVSIVSPWARPFVNVLSVMYVGYSSSVSGIFIGILWGFVDAFIGGWVFAWLYNKFVK